MKSDFTYTGKELELFARAVNWKKYLASVIKKYIKGDVAEVGAGPGNFTMFLYTDNVYSWTFIEPDEIFRKILKQKMDHQQLYAGNIYKTLSIVPDSISFDTILYIDVLEHIQNDKAEVSSMMKYLKPGGHIILLCPAFPYLYSSFDKEIGHFRRYSRRQLINLFDRRKDIVFCKYLDIIGFFSSFANRLFLRQKYPTIHQIKIWDSFMIPLSKILDKLLFYSFGRSLILVWKNPE